MSKRVRVQFDQIAHGSGEVSRDVLNKVADEQDDPPAQPASAGGPATESSNGFKPEITPRTPAPDTAPTSTKYNVELPETEDAPQEPAAKPSAAKSNREKLADMLAGKKHEEADAS